MSAEHEWGLSPQSPDVEISPTVSKFKYETVLIHPTHVYEHPHALIRDASLNKQQKREILESWAAEAIRLQSLLPEINTALEALASTERSDKADAA